MKRAELIRVETQSDGMDVVLTIEGDDGDCWVELDHHGNGTKERAKLSPSNLMSLSATLFKLIRMTEGRSEKEAAKAVTTLPAVPIGTLAEYYDLEDKIHRGDVRHEFFDGVIVAMTGGTTEHMLLTARVSQQLSSQLVHSRCVVVGSVMKVRALQYDRVFYPDVGVVSVVLEGDGLGGYTNPVVVVEVLAPLTKRADYETKLPTYKSVPSLRSILYVHQEERRVEVWTRLPSGEWSWYEHGDGSFEVLGLSGVVLDVDGLYAGVVK